MFVHFRFCYWGPGGSPCRLIRGLAIVRNCSILAQSLKCVSAKKLQLL